MKTQYKVSISKRTRVISPNGTSLSEKTVSVKGNNFKECSKEFDKRWKEE